MKIKKSLLIFASLALMLNSCSGLSDAGKVLRNQKNNTTDEFLIKKKAPLTQPPDFEIMPRPGSIEKSEEKDKNSFEKIFKDTKNSKNNTKTKSSSTEESILNQIK
ncbi:DUF3035 domain-containing protein [Pelagibacteraceae bacterium]|nr:DUF3035 domain-containing protein [Pelagibacteraceae bacterium]